MRKHTKILARSIVVATVALLVGCNSTLDEEPDVVLEVATMTVPPVTAAFDATTVPPRCVFTVTNATASFNNKPKNHFAIESPFNDIVLQSVSVSYVWDNGSALANTVFGIGGTVPANGAASLNFSVINAEDLIAAAGPDGGHTANLTMVFRGTTVSGDPVSVTAGGALTVDTCQ